MKNKKIILTNQELDRLICCSVRYSYSRHTGMPDFVRGQVWKHREHLKDFQIQQIIDDIAGERRINKCFDNSMEDWEYAAWDNLAGKLTKYLQRTK
mgnify:CR=1 FL=1